MTNFGVDYVIVALFACKLNFIVIFSFLCVMEKYVSLPDA